MDPKKTEELEEKRERIEKEIDGVEIKRKVMETEKRLCSNWRKRRWRNKNRRFRMRGGK